jgi:hypothetical protein
MGDLLTKSQFAAHIGVVPSRVTQYIAEGKLYGDGLVGTGHKARIRVSVAVEQLKRGLDVSQRISANGKARLDPAPRFDPQSDASPTDAPPTIDDEMKRQRLEQLELQNGRMREERAARAGIYVRADDSRREMGRVAAELLTAFEGALGEFATAIAARSNLTSRDALHLLRSTWRMARERASTQAGQRADALPSVVADHGSDLPLAEPSSPPQPSSSDQVAAQ